VRNVLTYCGLFTLGDTPMQAVRGVAEDGEKGDERRWKWNSKKPWRGVFFPPFDDRRDRAECDESP